LATLWRTDNVRSGRSSNDLFGRSLTLRGQAVVTEKKTRCATKNVNQCLWLFVLIMTQTGVNHSESSAGNFLRAREMASVVELEFEIRFPQLDMMPKGG